MLLTIVCLTACRRISAVTLCCAVSSACRILTRARLEQPGVDEMDKLPDGRKSKTSEDPEMEKKGCERAFFYGERDRPVGSETQSLTHL